MAEFGQQATELSAPQGAGATVTRPATVMPGQGVISEVASVLGDYLGKKKKQDAIDAKNAVMQQYSSALNAIDQGVTTGTLSAERAASMRRQTTSKYLAGYAQYTDDLIKITHAYKGETDLGAAESGIADVKSIRKDALNRASANGWVIPSGASELEQDRIIRADAEQTRTQKALDLTFRRNAEARAQGSFDNTQEDRANKNTAIALLNESVGYHLDALSASSVSAVRDAGNDPAKIEATKLHLTQMFTGIKAKLLATAGIEPSLAAPYQALLNDLEKVTMESLDPNKAGADRVKLLENAYNERILKAKILATSDKGVLAAVANNVLLPNNISAQLQGSEAGQKVFALITSVPETSGNPAREPVIGNPQVEDTVYKNLQSAISRNLKGEIPDKELATIQTTQGLNNLLRETSRVSSGNPKALNKVMSFFASPEFGKMSAQLDSEARSAVYRQFQIAYSQPYITKVAETLDEPIRRAPYPGMDNVDKNLKNMDMINLQVTSTGVKFVTKNLPNVPYPAQSDAVAGMRQSEAAVNQMIRIGAHLEGTTDYGAFFEKRKYDLFPNLYPVKTGDVRGGMEYIGKGELGDYRRKENWRPVSKPSE